MRDSLPIKLMVLLVLVLFLAVNSALAFTLPSWSFITQSQTVGPNDIVYLNATLTNNSDVDNLTFYNINNDGASGINGGGMSWGTFIGPGEYTWSSTMNASLEGFDLDPLGSIDFIFGTFTPPTVGAAVGYYEIASAYINFGVLETPQGGAVTNYQIYGGPFAATVEGCMSESPVPEPSTILLLGSGLLGLVWYGRKRKKA